MPRKRAFVASAGAAILLAGWALLRLAGSLPEPAGRSVPLAARPHAAVPALQGEAPGWQEQRGDLPPLGHVHVEVNARGLTLLANEAPLRRVLRELALALGFELVDAEEGLPRVSLVARDSHLEWVLAELLGETPYSLHYEFEAVRGRPGVARLVVGETPVAAARDDERDRRRWEKIEDAPETDEGAGRGRKEEDRKKVAQRAEQEARRAAYEPQELTPAERAAFERARQERQARRKEEHYAEAESEDVEQRRFAVGTLDVRIPDERRLLESALLGDPDWKVRREAAIQLGFGESRQVGPVLRRGLSDDHPDVVEAAIDSVSFARVREAIGELEELARSHPSEDVRGRARRTLRELRDS